MSIAVGTWLCVIFLEISVLTLGVNWIYNLWVLFLLICLGAGRLISSFDWAKLKLYFETGLFVYISSEVYLRILRLSEGNSEWIVSNILWPGYVNCILCNYINGGQVLLEREINLLNSWTWYFLGTVITFSCAAAQLYSDLVYQISLSWQFNIAFTMFMDMNLICSICTFEF